MTNPTLAQLAKIIEKRYPKNLASDWDSVGLIIGKQKNKIQKILLTVDVTKDVIEEALGGNFELIISHHPFVLEPQEVEDIRKFKDELKEKMNNKNLALYVAHTNADAAIGGVNDSIVKILKLKNIQNFGSMNIARFGDLDFSEKIEEIITKLKNIFPSNNNAILVSGDLDKSIKKIAVCGGSGSFLLEEVRQLKVDLFITADLKHHAVLDNKELNGPVLMNISHWASERIWLNDLENQLKEDLNKNNYSLEISISSKVTDPWDLSVGSN